MMGHRERMKGGDEWDAFTGWRRWYYWRAGKLHHIKKKFSRRVRREAKESLRKGEQ